MPLPRLQLFELEDQAWFPPAIRDLATDYLVFMETRFALHEPVVPILSDLLRKLRIDHVVDLCSGGGGPVLPVHEALAARGVPAVFTLTDKYPNIGAFRRLSSLDPERISFVAAAERSVLKSTVEARQPIAIFEIPERAVARMIPLLFTPLFVALATPFIRPFRWRRLLWTYLLPMVPLTCWWDGLVSQWRAYTVAELLELTRDLSEFEWTAARVPVAGTIGHLTYLTGIPKAQTGV